MLDGICAVRAPALGFALGGCRPPVVSEPFERVTDAKIGRQESVGIAERAHRYVFGGPRPDPRECQQAMPGLRAI